MANRPKGILRIARILLLLGMVAACQTAPTATLPIPTRRVLTLPAERPTLPPSWTPTDTPTATATPSPTNTPAPTQTATPLDESALCQLLFAVALGRADAAYGADDAIPFVIALGSDDASIRFSATHRQEGATAIHFTMPGGGLYALSLPVRQFPAEGIYDWEVSLTRADGSAFCQRAGTFQIYDATPTATPTATATATPRRIIASSPVPSATPSAMP